MLSALSTEFVPQQDATSSNRSVSNARSEDATLASTAEPATNTNNDNNKSASSNNFKRGGKQQQTQFKQKTNASNNGNRSNLNKV